MEFLASSYQQDISDLLQANLKTGLAGTIEVAKLQTSINLLGTLINLPIIVKQLADQFGKVQQNKDRAREIAEDPLEKELI